MSEGVKNEIKAWITPGLITVFWVVSWASVTEIKQDIKKLLESKAQLDVIIPTMEKRIDNVESRVQKIEYGIVQSHGSTGR